MELYVGLVVFILIACWVFHMWRLTRRRADIWKGRGAWKEPEDGRLFTITTEMQENAEKELLTYELPIRTLIEDESVWLPTLPLGSTEPRSGAEVVSNTGTRPRRSSPFQEFVFPLPSPSAVADLPGGPEETGEVPHHVSEVLSSPSEPDSEGVTTGVWRSGPGSSDTGSEGHGSH